MKLGILCPLISKIFKQWFVDSNFGNFPRIFPKVIHLKRWLHTQAHLGNCRIIPSHQDGLLPPQLGIQPRFYVGRNFLYHHHPSEMNMQKIIWKATSKLWPKGSKICTTFSAVQRWGDKENNLLQAFAKLVAARNVLLRTIALPKLRLCG